MNPLRSLITSLTVLSLSFATVANANSAPERTLLANPPKALTDFQLTNHENTAQRLSELRGTPIIVFFGFAHCPTVCPAALQQLRQLEREHKAALGNTRIVIISVDGERDTPAAMAAWLKPISKDFIGLTGAPDKVRGIAREFSAAFYKTPGNKPSEYLVEHSSQIFFIDAKGELRATFFNAPVATMASVVREMRGQK